MARPNIYHWPLVKTLEEINNEQSILASQKVISPTQAGFCGQKGAECIHNVLAVSGLIQYFMVCINRNQELMMLLTSWYNGLRNW